MRAAVARRVLEHFDTLIRRARHPASSLAQALRIEQRKMRFLLPHATETAPYYRSLFDDAGVRPEVIRVEHGNFRLRSDSTSESGRHGEPSRGAGAARFGGRSCNHARTDR